MSEVAPSVTAMLLSEIQSIVNAAEAHAGAVARSKPDSEDVRVLAIAVAETARAVGQLAKHVRELEG